MNFTKSQANLYIDDQFQSEADALARITHLAIGAHQDDIEIMAMEGIAQCLQRPDAFFAAITCTSGSGSARSGAFAHFTDEQMQVIRAQEQISAAKLGRYAMVAQLGHQSSEVKNNHKQGPLHQDLEMILKHCSPQVIYTHNLMDKHDTHVAVAIKLIEVLRQLPKENRPKKLIGCEVWRGLDWILDSDKVQMDISVDDSFVLDMVNIFASQVEGGKQYDLATLGRMHANSTFSESHAVDKTNKRWYGIDLTPLIESPKLDVLEFVRTIQENLYSDINQRISRYL